MSKDKTVLAELKLPVKIVGPGGKITQEQKKFEAICFPHKIVEFRAKKCSLADVLVDADNVYRKNGKERYNKKELEEAFGTTNVTEILQRIVEHGTFQVTTEEVSEAVAAKKREVINYLHSKYVDSKTGKPFTVAALTEWLDKHRFEPKRSAADQAKEIVDEFREKKIFMQKLEVEGIILVAPKNQAPVQKYLNGAGYTIYKMDKKMDRVQFRIGFNESEVVQLQVELKKLTNDDFEFDIPSIESKPPSAAGAAGGKKASNKKKGKQDDDDDD